MKKLTIDYSNIWCQFAAVIEPRDEDTLHTNAEIAAKYADELLEQWRARFEDGDGCVFLTGSTFGYNEEAHNEDA